jgi:hypothetical protein
MKKLMSACAVSVFILGVATTAKANDVVALQVLAQFDPVANRL